jgi:hypothetical protein
MELSRLFLGSNSLVLVIPPEKYRDILLESVYQLSTFTPKIGYISINRVINQIRKSIAETGASPESFYFVDCITKSIIATPEKHPNTDYVSSPNDLTKTSIAITKMLKKFEPEFVILDSMSTLLIYESIETSSIFLHALVNRITSYGSKFLLLSVPGEKEEKLIKNLSLVVDKIERI